MTPLAPMNNTMPNSLTVSNRQRLPPAIAAGNAAGRMTWRTMRSGRAPSRLATSRIEFLLSKEAQETVSSVAIGVPARKDVKPTDENFFAVE
jgi:ABC-type thiamine transport system substrate-binding protein